MRRNTERQATSWKTEKLLLRTYLSAKNLKEDIRKNIQDYWKNGWTFRGMNTRGPYLFICFKRKSRPNKYSQIDQRIPCGCSL